MLPLIVAALIVPPFVGFALGGTPAGTAAGALTIAALIVIAARSRHRGRIEFGLSEAADPVLVLALVPIEDTRTANSLAALVESKGQQREQGEHELLVLVPARSGRVQRWLSDTDDARVEAQRVLTISLATLAAAGTHAEGRVVDEDPIQAIEDVAAQHGASRVALVTDADQSTGLRSELADRLDRPVDRIEV